MSCLSRRDFLKFVGYSMLMSQLPYSPFVRPARASLNPLDWVDLMDLSCVSCSVNMTGCVKVKFSLTGTPKIKIAPKISYWIPEGFIESARKFEFGKSLPLAGLLSNVITPFTDLLSPFVPAGTYSIESATFSNTYMKLYPHYFGFPQGVVQAIKTAIMALNNLNPVCLACNLADSIKKVLIPQSKVMSQIEEKLKPIAEKLDKAKKFQENLQKIMDSFSAIQGLIPFFPAELFFFIWMFPQFHPDNYTIAPLFNSFIQTISQANKPLGMLMCPTLTEKIGKYVNLPFGIEASFICVGRWGLGYPRTGIVRHDDPIIAGLLSIARFHHLFSKTIPIVSPSFSYSDIKYQMYAPEKTGCFKPGYYASDPIAKALYSAEAVAQDIYSILQNPQQAISSIKDQAKQQIKELAKAPLSKASSAIQAKARTVGVVIWKRYSKCCW